MLHKFNENRTNFFPYGVTCQLWQKSKMLKPDRHNEIEINYLTEGSITYLISNRKVTLTQGKLAIFWALSPHQIIDFSGDGPYYVCTVPFNLFLSWNFSNEFMNNISKGNIVSAKNVIQHYDDLKLFERWRNDIEGKSDALKEVVLLELNARIKRLAHDGYTVTGINLNSEMDLNNIQVIEKLAAFITTNYMADIKVNDVAEKANLHPDYANRLFKNAFGVTIKEYITEQRISHAKRLLATDNRKISAIAFESGFNSLSRFNATFLKISGVTPKQYRYLHKLQD